MAYAPRSPRREGAAGTLILCDAVNTVYVVDLDAPTSLRRIVTDLLEPRGAVVAPDGKTVVVLPTIRGTPKQWS